ncbi:RAD55 family ATPase [Saliphagus infecundisoli]|uniref:RAD55 family ATPase n=1 Tax=Saliphagus infecundisoli TaxID=1849069 RepID=A0ABD5QI86_9EURY|nr:transcriptional regulator [Saliphagus infecundisoli]
MADPVATGIDVLDRKLAGGLPPGTIVAYTARPASQSELLLYELTAARRTLYLSTQRSAEAVSHAMERTAAPVGTPRIRRVGDDEPLAEARELVGALPADANLIVDTMDVIERTDRTAYTAFLNWLKEHLVETGSIAVLHCPKVESPPSTRSTTLHVADAVFDLRSAVGATELETYLTVPKLRGGGAPTETIKLELSERVSIDTSRDIA